MISVDDNLLIIDSMPQEEVRDPSSVVGGESCLQRTRLLSDGNCSRQLDGCMALGRFFIYRSMHTTSRRIGSI